MENLAGDAPALQFSYVSSRLVIKNAGLRFRRESICRATAPGCRSKNWQAGTPALQFLLLRPV